MVRPDPAQAIVGFDTATDDLAVAAVRAGEVLWERALEPGEDGRPRHSAELLALLEAAARAARGWSGVGTIAVGVGPGSFTGLRVGVATARALAQGLKLTLAPVGSLDALAMGLRQHEAAAGRSHLAAIDARRGQLFCRLHGPAGEPIWEPFVATPDELTERLGLARAELGSMPVAAGSGSLRFRRQLEAAGATVLADADAAHRLSGRHLCALASEATPVPAEAVEPTYLRPPDAEIWRERDRQRRRDSI